MAVVVAAAVLAAGVVRLATYNLERTIAAVELSPQLVVYLEHGVGAERAVEIAAALEAVPAVDRVAVVSGRQALTELALTLGEDADLIDGLEDDFLPFSLELALRGGVRDVATIHPFIDRIDNLPEVADVDVLGDWTERANSLLGGLASAGRLLLLLFAGCAAFVVAALMRIAATPDPSEVELLHRLGASPSFGWAPGVVAGIVRGAIGASIAAVALWGVFVAAGPAVSSLLVGTLGAETVAFLPGVELFALIAGGAGVGGLGGLLAAGSYRVS
jgi:cell division transport system permease protein